MKGITKEKFMEIGVTDKLVIDGNWQSFLRIGNQTFYFTATETKEDAEWFADQLKVGIDQLLKAERERSIKELSELSDGQIIYRIRKGKHIFTPQDDDKDFCKICEKNFRDVRVHLTVDEV